MKFLITLPHSCFPELHQGQTSAPYWSQIQGWEREGVAEPVSAFGALAVFSISHGSECKHWIDRHSPVSFLSSGAPGASLSSG